MSLIRRNYYSVPTVNRFFDDFFTKDHFWNDESELTRFNTIPAVNIREQDDSFQLELAAPGLAKKDFNIEVDENTLTVSFERKSDNQVTEENYKRREFGFQSFKRSFMLPETVDSEKIRGQYDNGILNLSIPKKPESKPLPVKTIKVS